MKLLSGPVLESFHDSYERCYSHPKFFDLFYGRFLESSQEIRDLFTDVNVVQVKRMVRDSLLYVLMASDGSRIGFEKLEKLGRLHKKLGAKRQHYVLWLDSLLSVVEELDPRYSREIDQAWREVMTVGIKIMQEPLSGQS